VDRVHRIGQIRDVVITRYIVQESVETVRSESSERSIDFLEKHTDREQYIQWVQQRKLRLISESLDSEVVSQSSIDNERWKVSDA